MRFYLENYLSQYLIDLRSRKEKRFFKKKFDVPKKDFIRFLFAKEGITKCNTPNTAPDSYNTRSILAAVPTFAW